MARHRSPAASLPLQKHLVAWFVAVHGLGAVGAWYWLAVRGDWRTLAMAGALFLACHLAIRAGSHSLYSHKAFKPTKSYELYVLIFFSGTFQYAVVVWDYFHRKHHWFSDTDQDPYSVRHGFWWAHMGWILRTPPTIAEPGYVRDLLQNPLVRWQQKHYYLLAALVGLVLPAALGALWSDWLGGLLVGGFLRLVVQYHSTWAVNSVAHSFGSFRYVPVATARTQNHWVWLPLVTVGEASSHERHHLAHEDYRIDPRWWALDVGKWFIKACALVGLVRDLRTVSEKTVEARAQKAILQPAE